MVYTGWNFRLWFLIIMLMHFVLPFFAWFAVLVTLMSFIEHQIHRRLMHKKSFFSVYFPALNKIFEHHAVLHHGQYYKIFDDKPVAPGQDRHIRLSIRE